MTIALYEDFTNPLGGFVNYQTYDAAQQTQLAAQKHVDIRSFEQLALLTPYAMFNMDGLAITTLDTLTMTLLENAFVVQPGENWSAGTVGIQADRNNFKGISLACTTGTNTTSSVLGPIAINQFAPTDYISLALPAFPLASLNTSSTFLDLTSEPSGNFATGPTDSIAFSASTSALIAGDCEARLAISLLTHVDLSKITGVRLRIQATGNCTFRCLAIRCLSAAWKFAPIDQNTLYDRLGACVPPSGSLTQPHSFPSATAPVSPSDFPALLWTEAGTSGPGAVDVEFGAVIHTGSNLGDNSLSVYLREIPLVALSIGSAASTTMNILDAYGATGAIDTQTMADLEALMLDNYTMEDLDALGRQPDYNPGVLNDWTVTKYLKATLEWGTNVLGAHIKDEQGNGFDIFGALTSSNADYYLLITLIEDSLRLQLYPLSLTGIIDWAHPSFDTTAVVDNNLVRRRRGRVGWYASLQDGDTYVKALRPRHVVYGEYRSAPLSSDTPVEGARIYPDASPNKELYSGSLATAGAILSPEVNKSRSGRCLRIDCSGGQPLQGLISAPVRFENLYDSEVSFDVLAPASTNLVALLSGESRLLLLYVPQFAANRWSHVRIPLDALGPTVMPGTYSLYLVQTTTATNTWYLDNLSIPTRAVSWQGRGQAADAWRLVDPAWIKFADEISDPYNAALLGRGNALQIRGQALTQDATINAVKILPKYAELGNFVWPEQAPIYGPAPVANFIAGFVSSRVMSFDASSSTAANGIAAYSWNFGDGLRDYGTTVTHTFPTSGNYRITLTVIDQLDLKTSTTSTISVS